MSVALVIELRALGAISAATRPYASALILEAATVIERQGARIVELETELDRLEHEVARTW